MSIINPLVAGVEAPPIADAWSWIEGVRFDAGRPLLDLCQAVPSYPPAPELTAHLARVVARPDSAFYTDILGLPALREALARHLCEAYAAEIDPAEVGITAGCNQAFCVVMAALAGPGDEVLLPLPYYFNHAMWLQMQGIGAVHLPFEPGRGGVPDPAAAAQRITGRTRAIVLVTPNNPTGAEYPPDVIEDFYRLARQRDLYLVIDETYKDFRAAEGPAHGLFSLPGWRDTFVQLYSFSKVFSLTGYRVGAAIAAAPLLAQVAKVLDCVSICAPRIGQEAALYGLAHLAAWREEKRAMMRERGRALERVFRRNDLRYRLVTTGAYFAYVEHPFEGERSTAVAKRLAREAGVLCLPGEMFGPDQERYLRFAFANLDADRIPEIGERLAASD